MIDLQAPDSQTWEFLLLFAAIVLGPVIIERAKAPGIIGLILAGFAIGPHGVGFIEQGNTTVPDLGHLGLLYLMFMAGVELDLKILSERRGQVVSFGILTFSLPMIGGTIVGLALGWSTPAALLLGSLLASHTLLFYPIVRQKGLTSDAAVATAVGATVLTDTIALVILAGVAGTQTGSGSTIELMGGLVIGLAVLVTFCVVVLPWLAGFVFERLGTKNLQIRYAVAVLAFLSAAAVAEVFGIEGIVGGFFAGLGMNRLIPNGEDLMDRVEFYGGAVFIPIFLISVGLILDPSVMAKPETLGLAGLFIAACIGGKLLAALAGRRLLGWNAHEAGVVFALTTPQAAATLASTVVGFNIGLFSSSVVNAVLVLILVSVLISTIYGSRAADRMAAAG